jgi:hypothetical protein
VNTQIQEEAISVVETWTDRQGVANILFYPDLLPPSTQLRFLKKGLEETEFPYYALAAVLGLQTVTERLDKNLADEDLEREMDAIFAEERWGDFAQFGEPAASHYEQALGSNEWESLRERLLVLIERGGEVMSGWEPSKEVHILDEVIADRASAILIGFVTREDVPRLLRLLEHPSEVVRNNILTTLLFLVRKDEVKRLVGSEVEAGRTTPTTTQFVASAREPMSPLWSYIPNLSELHPAEEASERL